MDSRQASIKVIAFRKVTLNAPERQMSVRTLPTLLGNATNERQNKA